jgi:hypothetical protein
MVRVCKNCIPDLTSRPGIAHVDHLTPLAEGGAMYDMSNLRSACRPCNLYLAAQLGRKRQEQAARRPAPRVW